MPTPRVCCLCWADRSKRPIDERSFSDEQPITDAEATAWWPSLFFIKAKPGSGIRCCVRRRRGADRQPGLGVQPCRSWARFAMAEPARESSVTLFGIFRLAPAIQAAGGVWADKRLYRPQAGGRSSDRDRLSLGFPLEWRVILVLPVALCHDVGLCREDLYDARITSAVSCRGHRHGGCGLLGSQPGGHGRQAPAGVAPAEDAASRQRPIHCGIATGSASKRCGADAPDHSNDPASSVGEIWTHTRSPTAHASGRAYHHPS